VDVQTRVFLTSVLVGSEWLASRPCRFTPGERAHVTRCIGDWVGLRAGLDDMEKWKFLPSPPFELRPLGRPPRSQSQYRLRYPGSLWRMAVSLQMHELLWNEDDESYFSCYAHLSSVQKKQNSLQTLEMNVSMGKECFWNLSHAETCFVLCPSITRVLRFQAAYTISPTTCLFEYRQLCSLLELVLLEADWAQLATAFLIILHSAPFMGPQAAVTEKNTGHTYRYITADFQEIPLFY
jgi:hypothetical protein